LMTAVVLVGNFTNLINRRVIEQLIPIVVVVIGIIFILRGLGLGIPYISPKPLVNLVVASGCH